MADCERCAEDTMAISVSAIGTDLSPARAQIERGRLRFFASVIGLDDPLYTDVAAANAAGYPDLLVPPSFLFGVKLEGPDPFRWLIDLGVDFRNVLHGAQKFVHEEPAFAGDELELRPRISDVYDKKGGVLEFVVVETAVTRAGTPIATLVETIVVRHPELEQTA